MLRLPYVANLVILLPVCASMFWGRNQETVAAFEDKVAEVAGLRLLVASLWCAILLCSIGGLFAPQRFVPILLLQVIYKALYLAIYVVPTARSVGWRGVPLGVAISFAAIVAIWPWFLWQAHAAAGGADNS